MTEKESFRLAIENKQLKKKIEKLEAAYEQLVREYKELAEFAQTWAERRLGG